MPKFPEAGCEKLVKVSSGESCSIKSYKPLLLAPVANFLVFKTG